MKQFGKQHGPKNMAKKTDPRDHYPELLVGMPGTYTVLAPTGQGFVFQTNLQWDGGGKKHVPIVREPVPLCGTARPIFFRHELIMAEEGSYTLAPGRIGQIQAQMLEVIRSAMPTEIACLKAYREAEARKSAIEHSENVFVLDDQRHHDQEQQLAAAVG